MTFLDFFAGIGGFRRGLELDGHKCLGFCEWDRFAVASYTSMHCITDEQREYLATLDLKQRQKEILKDEYRNGEWYAADIRSVDAGSMPRADCWCFGFPCQDISKSGKQAGFSGDRSSLFFSVTRIIRELPKEDRPKWLLIENVRNLLSINRGLDFAKLLIELDEIGYDTEWQVLNSKDFGVPQNRERVFIVGHLRNKCTAKIFPVERPGRSDFIHGIEMGKDDESMVFKVYDGTKRGYTDAHLGDGITLSWPGSNNEHRGKVGKKMAHTLQTCPNQGVVVETGDDFNGYSIWNERLQSHIAIRRLTPRECFRLQGWADDYFDRAQFVNSDSQLYKQAGNGVTVNVVQAIGERM